MDYDIEMNQKDYQKEKEICSKRLAAYTEAIQRITLEKSSKVIDDLVEERHRQGLTQRRGKMKFNYCYRITYEAGEVCERRRDQLCKFEIRE